MFALDAYLERIGLSGAPSVAEVHRAHSTSIPFENLDPHLGLPASTDIEDIQRKLVLDRRGGYCFEQNLLFGAALRALGAEVDMYLARVRLGAPPGVIRPRSHLVLEVRRDGERLHADVGFGLGTLFDPLPFGAGAEYEQLGWRYRIVEDEGELVLQTLLGERWSDLYGFPPQPVPMIDIETVNWWVSTHPRSPFVTGLIVSLQRDDGLRTCLSNWDRLALTESTPAGASIVPVGRGELPGLLASRFALPGFSLDQDGRLLPPRPRRPHAAPR